MVQSVGKGDLCGHSAMDRYLACPTHQSIKHRGQITPIEVSKFAAFNIYRLVVKCKY